MLLIMKKVCFITGFLVLIIGAYAQNLSARLSNAFEQFENDAQLKHAISSLYVINAQTGEIVLDKNSQIGLAPASTQKIITSVTAFELLGKDYMYKTRFGFNKDKNILYIKPGGDPTLGSWRWNYTKEGQVIKRVVQAIQKMGITNYSSVLLDNPEWNAEAIPDGWIWQDIGNYYGAGADGLNWRENQFDLVLKSGKKIGEHVEIVGTIPSLYNYELTSYASSAAKGTGDNVYIYFPLSSSSGAVRGTIPVNENRFIISGAMKSGSRQFMGNLLDSLQKEGIRNRSMESEAFGYAKGLTKNKTDYTIFHTEYSPPLDSLIYWFNKKSINLYGEALVKTFAYEKQGFGRTDSGVSIIKDFWEQKGIDPEELNIYDGSGLSPLNRVTTHAQVEVLRYAKKQSWFSSFYYSLPEYNDMKIKSGTISEVKGFTGYHSSKDGTEYIFSFLVNNYNGSASALVQKMYKVLNVLK